jgi:predicted enzyme related to lactoylglutathione lyase
MAMEERFTKHGDLSWCELMTSDAGAATAFYTQLFGWGTEDMSMGAMTYTVVKAGEKRVGGITKTPPQAQGMPPMWTAYITVDDIDATAKKAVELGGKVLVPPTDIPGVGRFAAFQDPQGAMISAITYKRM